MGYKALGQLLSSLENYSKPTFFGSRRYEGLVSSNLQLSKQSLAKIKQYSKFYHELIQIWAKASGKEPSRTLEICEEVLWNNKMITSNGDSLFNKHFILKGILTIRDIIDEYGVPLS